MRVDTMTTHRRARALSVFLVLATPLFVAGGAHAILEPDVHVEPYLRDRTTLETGFTDSTEIYIQPNAWNSAPFGRIIALNAQENGGEKSRIWSCVLNCGSSGYCSCLVPIPNYIPFTVSGGDGEKTVWVEARDTSASSTWGSASIWLDTLPPTGSITINNGQPMAPQTRVTLAVYGTDAGSGLNCFRLKNDDGPWSDGYFYCEAWRNYVTDHRGTYNVPVHAATCVGGWDLTPGNGPKKVSVQLVDLFGRYSSVYSANIDLDTTPPGGTLVLNNADKYTNKLAVRYAVQNITGLPIFLRIKQKGEAQWEPDRSYFTGDYTLADGADGPRTLTYAVIDAYYRMPAEADATIIVDRAAPSGTITVQTRTDLADPQVTLNITGVQDAQALLSELQMAFRNPGDSWSAWEPVPAASTTKSWRLTYTGISGIGDYERTIEMALKDPAGNVSTTAATTTLRVYPGAPQGFFWLEPALIYLDTRDLMVNFRITRGVPTQAFLTDVEGSWGTALPFQPRIPFTLTDADGVHTVRVKLTDTMNSETVLEPVSVYLDRTGPTGSIEINGGASSTTSHHVQLTLSATDDGSGLDAARVRNGVTGEWTAWQDWWTFQNWALPEGDGAKTVQVQYRDRLANESPPYSATINLVENPLAYLRINEGEPYSRSRDVTVNVITDLGPGTWQMRLYSPPDKPDTGYEPLAASVPITYSSDGEKTVWAEFWDGSAGYVTASAKVVVDTEAPWCDVYVTETYVNVRDVTATVSAFDAATSVAAIRLRNGTDAWGPWQAYTPSTALTWQLAPQVGEAVEWRTVSVECMDAAGNATLCDPATNICTDKVAFDTTIPVGNLEPRYEHIFATSRIIDLAVDFDDPDGVGLKRQRFSNDMVDWSEWSDYVYGYPPPYYAWALTQPEGIVKVYVQVEDWAGNVGEDWTFVVLDTLAPSGTVSINEGEPYARSSSVDLSLDAFDAWGVNRMQFSEDKVTWTTEESYSTHKAWQLAPGDGVRTVWVRFQDIWWTQWSEPVSDDIIVDATAPVVTVSLGGSEGVLSHNFVDLILLATDVGTGVEWMRLRNVGGEWSQWEPYAATKQWALLPDCGEREVVVEVRDRAGNISSSSVAVTVDVEPPTGSIALLGAPTYTLSRQVVLELSADDVGLGVEAVLLRNEIGDVVRRDWPVTDLSWTLSEGGGPKTVFAVFEDAAGHRSQEYSASVVYETAPVAHAGGPYVVAFGTPLGLDGSASGDPDAGDSLAGAAWDLNDDGEFLEVTGLTVTLTWAEVESAVCGGVGQCMLGTIYPVALEVVDNYGQSDTAGTTVVFRDSVPVAVASASSTAPECGAEVTFSGSDSRPGLGCSLAFWEWDFEYDGTTFVSQASGIVAAHAYSTPGSHTVALRVTDDDTPPASAVATLSVMVGGGNQPPIPRMTGPYALASGDALRLDASGSTDPNAACGDAVMQARWDLDDDGSFDDALGAAVTLTAAEYEPLMCGGNGACQVAHSYPISVEVTDKSGANTSLASIVTFVERPAPPVACGDGLCDPTDENLQRCALDCDTNRIGVTLPDSYGGESFGDAVHTLGAHSVVITIDRSQVETGGERDFTALDAAVHQLAEDDALILRLTTQPDGITSDDLLMGGGYYRFVQAVVERTAGAVPYVEAEWEVDDPRRWSGTPAEYAQLMRVFAAAASQANPLAVILMAGPRGELGLVQQRFFGDLLRELAIEPPSPLHGIDLSLYADLYDVPTRLGWYRDTLALYPALAGLPLFVLSTAGPMPYEFRGQAPSEWQQLLGEAESDPCVWTGDLAGYTPQLRMFGQSQPDAELEARRVRIQAREQVQRTLLALDAGARQVFWRSLWEPPFQCSGENSDPWFAQLRLMDQNQDGSFTARPAFTHLQTLLAQIGQPHSIERVATGDDAVWYVFQVTRADRKVVYVAWQRRDLFYGEEEGQAPFALTVPWAWVDVQDLFGQTAKVEAQNGKAVVQLTDTPCFIVEGSPEEIPTDAPPSTPEEPAPSSGCSTAGALSLSMVVFIFAFAFAILFRAVRRCRRRSVNV